MQKPHCEGAPQKSSNTALLPNPSFPRPMPEIPAQLWVPSLREPPVYANIITWSQKDEAGHWGHPFWLPRHLLSCFPPALLLRWMHKSQAVGITFCCPCTCFAFSRNLPGCQSRTRRRLSIPREAKHIYIAQRDPWAGSKIGIHLSPVLQTAWQYTGCEL